MSLAVKYGFMHADKPAWAPQGPEWRERGEHFYSMGGLMIDLSQTTAVLLPEGWLQLHAYVSFFFVGTSNL